MQGNYRQRQRMITKIPKTRNKSSGRRRFLKVLTVGMILLFSGVLAWYLFPHFVPFDLSVPNLERTLQTSSFSLRKELKQIHAEHGFLPDFLPSEEPAVQAAMKRITVLSEQYLQDDVYLYGGSQNLSNADAGKKERYPERIWEFSYAMEKMLAENRILPRNQEWQDGQVLCRIANFSADEYKTAIALGITLDAKEALVLLRFCAVAGLRQAMPDIRPMMIFQQTLQQMGDHTYPAEFLEDMSQQFSLFRQEQFPQKRFIMAHRLKTIQDFERLRLNGVSLFLGERLPEQQIKDAVRDLRIGNFFSGISAAVRDLRYDEDKDELAALQMYRFLLVPDFVTSTQYPAVLMSKIPRQCVLARIVHQDLRDTIEQLTRIYAELENYSMAVDILEKSIQKASSEKNTVGPGKKIPLLNRFNGTETIFTLSADAIQWNSNTIRITDEKEMVPAASAI